MSSATDEAEHSMEMQLPYLHLLLRRLYPGKPTSAYPPLVPIMVGSTSTATEKAFGSLLAPYLADPQNAFVISTDFCHWGSRFGYTYYIPGAPSPPLSAKGSDNLPSSKSDASVLALHADPALGGGRELTARDKTPFKPQIWESIAHADRGCMCAIATGSHSNFVNVLRETGNTVCGRHPIGVVLAGLEEVRKSRGGTDDWARWDFLRYQRSGDCVGARESSVSYVSAACICD